MVALKEVEMKSVNIKECRDGYVVAFSKPAGEFGDETSRQDAVFTDLSEMLGEVTIFLPS